MWLLLLISQNFLDGAITTTIVGLTLNISPQCPQKGLESMLATGTRELHLFQIFQPRGDVPLTESVSRKLCMDISKIMAFLRTNTCHDYNRGVPHGLWTWCPLTGHKGAGHLGLLMDIYTASPVSLLLCLPLLLYPPLFLAISSGCLGSSTFLPLA